MTTLNEGLCLTNCVVITAKEHMTVLAIIAV